MNPHMRLILLLTMAFLLTAPLSAQGPDRVSVLIELSPGADRGPVREFAANQGGHVRYEYSILPHVINLRNMPVAALNGLRNMPGVVRIWEDPVLQATIHQSVPIIQGSQSQIQGSGFAVKGSGVRICVPDTGIDSNQWMFQDYPDTTVTRIDYAAALNLIGEGFPEDDQGHGSHVAGIAAGREGLDFENLPFQGVAPKATIIPVKVLDSQGTGDGSDLIEVFEHCTRDDLPGGRADVISLSLGYASDPATCNDDPVVQAANAAVQRGVVIVAASGNDGSSNALSAPACGSEVISVGATYDFSGIDWNCLAIVSVDQVACFSNKSPLLDVVAPGCSIHSALCWAFLAPIDDTRGLVRLRGRAVNLDRTGTVRLVRLDLAPSIGRVFHGGGGDGCRLIAAPKDRT